MPIIRNATLEELQEAWSHATRYWGKTVENGSLNYPWVQAGFIVTSFKIALRQRGLRIPSELGGVTLSRIEAS
jgi:hypothetical protein